MNKEEQDARILALKNEIKSRQEEIKSKEAELNNLRVAQRMEELGLGNIKVGDIVSIEGMLEMPGSNLIKINDIIINDDDTITLDGSCFNIYVGMKIHETIINDTITINIQPFEGKVPNIEVKTADEWNKTIEEIINDVNGMKC